MAKAKKRVSTLPITHCICGHAAQLNRLSGRGMHPGPWEVRVGAGIVILCIVLLTMFLSFLLIPFGMLVGGLIVAVTLVKLVRGHSPWCALRDGTLVVIGYFARSLNILLYLP